MSNPIVNPRRGHRAAARCRTAISSTDGEFVTETEDIGARGCQVVSPRSLPRGRALTLLISNPKVRDDLRAHGRVVWVSPQPPWRLGIAFDASDAVPAARFMEALLVAFPSFNAARRIPDRIAEDATVYLGTPPRLLVDFNDDELRILRAVGMGSSVGDLRAGQGEAWTHLQRSFFSLLGAQHLTLSRPGSSHPLAWRHVLGDAAVAGLHRSSPPMPAAVGPLRGAPAEPAARAAAPAPAPTPPPLAVRGSPQLRPTSATPPSGRDVVARSLDPSAGGAHPPDHTGAGAGWRAPAGARPPEAQECLDRAAVELAAGRAMTALALLRRALALAPGDREIASAIGAAMFRSRS